MAEAVAIGEQFPWPDHAYRDIRYRGKPVEDGPSSEDFWMHFDALDCTNPEAAGG